MKTIKEFWKTKPSSWWSWRRQSAPSYRQSARRWPFTALACKWEQEMLVFRIEFTSITFVLSDTRLRPDKVNSFYIDFEVTEPKTSNFFDVENKQYFCITVCT